MASWKFHKTVHGASMTLKNNQQTALRKKEKFKAVVISSDYMKSNTVYQVRLDAIEGDPTLWTLFCGVTYGPPENLSMRTEAWKWPQAITIGYCNVWKYGQELQCVAGKYLRGVRIGGNVGVMVDKDENLHLLIQGYDLGVVCRGVQRPCNAFFYVWGPYKQVTTLPMEYIESVETGVAKDIWG